MTGDELRTELRTLIDDDNIESAQELRWINQSYNRINTMKIWNFLRKEDSSKTIATGTTSYAVPSDFLYPSDDKFYLLDSSGNVVHRIKWVGQQNYRRFNDQKGYAYLDLVNSNIVFTASDVSDYSGLTLHLPYQYQPTELTASTEPVFNKAFHMILAYHAAKHFWYNDQQEKDRSFHREMEAEYQNILADMERWDNHLEFATNSSFQPLDNWAPGVD